MKAQGLFSNPVPGNVLIQYGKPRLRVRFENFNSRVIKQSFFARKAHLYYNMISVIPRVDPELVLHYSPSSTSIILILILYYSGLVYPGP